jgi:hypothetical protein
MIYSIYCKESIQSITKNLFNLMIFTADNGFREELGLGYNTAGLNRMNARFQVFLEPYREALSGSSVLDLASHDGRWSWAALQLGARCVTGVEARADLIAKGIHLFDNSALKSRSEFIEGDIFEVLPDLKKQGRSFGVILCLGIFYHVMDHYRLLRLIRSFEPHLVILDTGLINDDKSYINLNWENTGHFLNTIGSMENQDKDVVGVVSKGGLRMMCQALGFSCQFLEWDASRFESRANLWDYFDEELGGMHRYSVILRTTVDRSSLVDHPSRGISGFRENTGNVLQKVEKDRVQQPQIARLSEIQTDLKRSRDRLKQIKLDLDQSKLV